MEIQTAIHMQPESYTGPRIQKGETSGRTQPAAPVSLRPEISPDQEEKENSSHPATLNRLTPAQMRMLSELKSRDQEVRAHEQAHVAAGGGHVSGGIRYNYQKGPDGRMYAIGGEVSIDVSPVPGDPEATARKMEQVRRAALAPMDPSPQDRSVAARATMIRSDALQEIALMQMEERQKQAVTEGKTEEQPYGPREIQPGSFFSIQA
ncbi:SprA family protein [Desulfobotulus alkaliphilus]|uniref:SprA family protein n=1 Tax=Desulfobotulus alkaliphilus TaxID=622671 RepID=A0A562RFP3_9BACT|nr:putative metalloprotease CJM1_0395 family protein [Desulfobotulus alkaliphilus]TWI67230.1 SprA family protein [Desulfobotulus alkaliphilus]